MAQEWKVESIADNDSLQIKLNQLRSAGIDGYQNILWESEFVESGPTYIDTDDRGGAGYVGVWGDGTYIYTACYDDGLRTYSVDGSGDLTYIDVDYQGGSYVCVWGDGNFIYTGTSDGFRSYSVDRSGNLTHIDRLSFSDRPIYGVWGDGTFIYVANSISGLSTLSVDGSGNLTRIDSDDQGGTHRSVWGDGTYIYVACDDGGIRSYSVDGSGNLTYIDTDDQGGQYLDVWGDGNFIYAACDDDGLRTYSVDGSGNLTYIDTEDQGGNYVGVWGDGNFIYASCDESGLRTYSVDGSGYLTYIDRDGRVKSHYDVWGDGTYIYTACGGEGLRTYSPPSTRGGAYVLSYLEETVTEPTFNEKWEAGDGSVWNGTAFEMTGSEPRILVIGDWAAGFEPSIARVYFTGADAYGAKFYDDSEHEIGSWNTTYTSGTAISLDFGRTGDLYLFEFEEVDGGVSLVSDITFE